VWVDEDEIDGLAGAKGMSAASFRARYLRRLLDPASGVPRLALRERASGESRESGAACALLEGASHCTVYDARPRHCRTFPFWPSILSDADAFERARSVCPGIAVEPEEDQRRRAFARLAALYARADAIAERSGAVCILRGGCCRFEEAGHELYATALEADYAAARHPDAPAPEAPGRCPYHVAGRCTAREGRPLGCRTYFCDPRTQAALAEEHEELLREVRRIEREEGYPAASARFPALLAARGVGAAPATATARAGMGESREASGA
jgi:Fe-S-cluster containining protein